MALTNSAKTALESLKNDPTKAQMFPIPVGSALVREGLAIVVKDTPSGRRGYANYKLA